MQRFLKRLLKISFYGIATIAAFTFAFTSRSYRALTRYTLVNNPSYEDLKDLFPSVHADGGYGGGKVGGTGRGAKAAGDGWFGDGWGGDSGGDSSGDGSGADGGDGDGGEGGDCDGDGDGDGDGG